MSVSSNNMIVMQGSMMKKKGGTSSGEGSCQRSFLLRSISLKWVTRYFILHQDGRLIYYKDRPSKHSDGSNDGGTVLCANVADCDIERVTASDTNSAVDPSHVANSFFITAPSTTSSSSSHGSTKTTKTLLVTNGPNEYKQWILSFRQLRASMLHGWIMRRG
mmetsp:Transcript_27567/g.47775  ORF Transcript_27567/g.47775 Transcript_27567/m.47775 type:complete len:162 (+) Transcript_27567:248-733(+)